MISLRGWTCVMQLMLFGYSEVFGSQVMYVGLPDPLTD